MNPLRVFVCLAAMAPALVHGAVSPLTCVGTAAQAVIRAEGLAERVGDIVLQCSSTVPGGDVVSSVQVTLGAPVAQPNTAQLTFERGGVVLTTLAGAVTGTNTITFPPINQPLDGTAQATIRISNVRVDASGRVGQQIAAFIGTTSPTGLGVAPNPVVPAVVQAGLLVNASATQILCVGSPVPDEEPLTLAGVFGAGTAFATLRATEGSSDAFQTRLPGATVGTRILVQLSGFPDGARVFLPTALAGSSATQPTSAGDLGLTRSGGRYTPQATGSLLLSQVAGAASNGVGGNVLFRPGAPGSGTALLLDAREIPLVGGAGVAVFEVMDSNSTIVESTQIPVFVSLAANSPGRGAVAEARLALGPISTGSGANVDTPRFVANQVPARDCTVLNDCNAAYFPKLEVDAPALEFSALFGSRPLLSKRVIVRNARGGIMPWRVSWTYQNGAGWLNVVNATGVNQAAFQLDANVAAIAAPGLYKATLVIDAGPLAGTVQLPVTFEASGTARGPNVGSALNAAGPNERRLVAGSRAVIDGIRFPDVPVVTFDGIAAQVIAAGPERIEVVVPDALSASTSARLVVSDGANASEALEVPIVPSAPVIYRNAIFNQDNAPNTITSPESLGNVLQVFLTGLPLPQAGRITVKIQGETQTIAITDVPYAGAAPGFAGVQQVNLRLPQQMPTGFTQLLVCGLANATGAEVCAPGVRIYTR